MSVKVHFLCRIQTKENFSGGTGRRRCLYSNWLPNILTNLDLLKTVRAANPEAYIVYKPHPDVVSGNRIGHIAESQVVKLADQITKTENVLDCINAWMNYTP